MAQSEAPVPRVNLDPAGSPVLLALVCPDSLVPPGRSAYPARWASVDPRESLAPPEPLASPDPLGSLVPQGSSLVQRKAVQASSVQLIVQPALRAHRVFRESRDTRGAPVFSETRAASVNWAPKERRASPESKASQDQRVRWASAATQE